MCVHTTFHHPLRPSSTASQNHLTIPVCMLFPNQLKTLRSSYFSNYLLYQEYHSPPQRPPGKLLLLLQGPVRQCPFTLSSSFSGPQSSLLMQQSSLLIVHAPTNIHSVYISVTSSSHLVVSEFINELPNSRA